MAALNSQRAAPKEIVWCWRNSVEKSAATAQALTGAILAGFLGKRWHMIREASLGCRAGTPRTGPCEGLKPPLSLTPQQPGIVGHYRWSYA